MRALYTRKVPLPAADVEEVKAARSAWARVDRSARGLLRVVGGERLEWLQGMVSNDVVALGVGSACEATVLSPKGAMVALVRVLRRESEVLLELPASECARVLEHLNRLLISEDAELSAAPELAVLGVIGPSAPAAPAAALGVLPGPLPHELDFVVPRAELLALDAALGPAPTLSTATLEVLRVEAGVPEWGAELKESTIPLEANLERAINYKKGCYVGQEVIARGTFRGQMNKRLVGVRLGAVHAPVGTELFKGEKKVGALTSVVRAASGGEVLALAYVHRDALTPGTELLAAGQPAVVAALPFP